MTLCWLCFVCLPKNYDKKMIALYFWIPLHCMEENSLDIPRNIFTGVSLDWSNTSFRFAL